MKYFARAALALLALFVVGNIANAQTEYESLVRQDSVSITRINLDKLSAEQLSQVVQKVGNAAVDYFVDDKEQKDSVKKLLPIAGIFLSQFFESNVQPFKDAGVKDAYFVVDLPEDPAETYYPYVAFPVASMNEQQKKDLRDAVSNVNKQIPESAEFTLKYRFERNGFLFILVIPKDVDQSVVKEYMKNRFTTIEPAKDPFAKQAFDAIGPNVPLSGVNFKPQNSDFSANQISQLFKQLEGNEIFGDVEGLKEKVTKLDEVSKKLQEKVQYSYWFVDVDNLEITSVVQANSPDDAKAYLNGIESDVVPLINEIIDAGSKISLGDEDAQLDDSEKDLLLNLCEHVKKLVVVFTKSTVKDSEVVWKLDESFWKENRATFTDFIDFVKKDLLPKVQSDVNVEDLEDLEDLDFEAL